MTGARTVKVSWSTMPLLRTLIVAAVFESTGTVVIAKLATVPPFGIVTEAGIVTFVELEDRVNVVLPCFCAYRVIEPEAPVPPVTLLELRAAAAGRYLATNVVLSSLSPAVPPT